MLYVMLLAGAMFSFVWLLLLRKRLRLKWYAALILAVIHTLVGVFSVKVFAFLEAGFNPDTLGNMSLFGGVFFMPLTYLVGARLTKRRASEVCDVFTICMIFTVMCARINCIFAGCCKGLLIPGLDGLRWPTREAEILFYIIILLLFIPKVQKGGTRGKIYPIYMAAYGGFRFAIEFFRVSDSYRIFHRAHIWSLIALGLGLSIYFELSRREEKNSKNKRRKKHDKKYK